MIKSFLIKILIRTRLWTFLRPFYHKLERRIDRRDCITTPLILFEKFKYLIVGKTFCDLGCRRGHLMKDLQECAKKVIGIEKEIAYCRMCWKKGLEVIRGDILKDEIPEADVYYIWLHEEIVEKVIQRLRGRKAKLIIRFQSKIKVIDLCGMK